MRFDINEYNGGFCMHCPTKENAHIFLAYLDSVGRQWSDGESYLVEDNHVRYGQNTHYYFNKGLYGTSSYAKDNGYTILEFDDFVWGKEEPDALKIEQESVEILDAFLSAIKIN